MVTVKSPLNWMNIDENWLSLYIHQNRELVEDIEKIEYLLPNKNQVEKGLKVEYRMLISLK